jgi:hypothetical protein
MKILILGCILVAAMAPSLARADDQTLPYIPATFYPEGSRITFSADYSNESMDAAWDFDANGEPLMHRYPQHVFLRQAGWMEQGFVQHGYQIAWFILFDSTYGTFSNGQNGNVIAYRDLRLMLTKWWHAGLAKQQPQGILPAGVNGAIEARVIPKLDDGPFLVTSVWWGNTREIEAIAFSTPHLIGRTQLRQMLNAQIRYAMGLPQDR